MKRGICIHFAGVNNIGKSTQLELLADWLAGRGAAVERVKFPVYALGERGEFIRRYLKEASFREAYRRKHPDAEQRLARAVIGNRHDFEPTLAAWLTQGKWVLVEGAIIESLAWSRVCGLAEHEVAELHRTLSRANMTLLLNEKHGRRYARAVEAEHVNETDEVRIAAAWAFMLASAGSAEERVRRLDFDLAETREAIAERVRRLLGLEGVGRRSKE